MKKTKVNVLFPTIARKPVGGHKVVYEYCNKLVEDGYDVRVYYFPLMFLSNYHVPEFMRIPLAKAFGNTIGPRGWFHFHKNIKTRVIEQARKMRSADVVIATGIETAEPVFNLPEKYGKKLYFIQDFENWTVSDETVFNSYALGMKNVVVSKWLQGIVDKYSKEPSILISNGINTSIFKSDNRLRTDHSIVFQYRSSKQKGCEYALETIRILKQKYPDLSVNIISIEKNKPDIPSYCHYHFGLTPEQVAEVNNQSEVFICSTIDEGFGLPGLEAMACGCAVCSTDYTGVHEYAVNGYNALLSPVRDPQAMADNVSRLFDDEDLREKIVANGIKTRKEKSVDNSYQKFKKVLEDIINE